MARGNGHQPTAESERIAALEAQVSELTGILTRMMPVSVGSDAPTVVERVVRLETALGANPEDLAGYETWKQWAALPANEKTQLEADKLWCLEQSLPCWRVSLWHSPDGSAEHAKAKKLRDWPEVRIPAHSEEEARARWQKVCGVRALTVPELFLRAERDTAGGRPPASPVLAAPEDTDPDDRFDPVPLPEGHFEESAYGVPR